MNSRSTNGRRNRWLGAVAAVGAGAVLARTVLGARSRSVRQVRGTGRSLWPAEPEMTDLLSTHAGRVDFADAWAVTVRPDDSRSAADWAHAALSPDASPSLLTTLMRLRDALVRPFGLERVSEATLPYTGFPLLAAGDDEVVLGIDDTHLDFRVGVLVTDARCTMTTTVTLHNALGRVYWLPVRWFHPWAVRTVLRRVREVPTADTPEVA